jgi:methyl-accepting chemotaxis protein
VKNKQKTFRIRKRVNIVFISVCIFVVLLDVTAFMGFRELKTSVRTLDSNYMPIISEIAAVQANFIDSQRLAYKLLLEEDPSEQARLGTKIQDKLKAFNEHAANYKEILAKYETEASSEATDEFNKNVKAYFDVLPQVIELRQKGGADNNQAALELLKSTKDPFNNAEAILEGAILSYVDKSDDLGDSALKQNGMYTLIILVYGSIAILSSIFSAIWISRTLRKSSKEIVANVADISSSMHTVNEKSLDTMTSSTELVRLFTDSRANFREMVISIQQGAGNAENTASSVEQISAAIEEMSRSIQGVASSAKELNTSADATSSAVQQMAVSIEQVAKNAGTINQLSQQVEQRAKNGQEALSSNRKGMSDISDVVKHAADVMVDLGNSSNAIGSIISVIDDIADQTNLLALNAAIEAARAGDHGKGFAVVADEVRKLAERSAKATKEIAGLIEGIQHKSKTAVQAIESGTLKVDEGTRLTEEADKLMQEIADAIHAISREISQISIAMAEQANGTDHIVSAVATVATQSSLVTQATKEQELGSAEIVRGIMHARDQVTQIMHGTTQQAGIAMQVTSSLEHIIEKADEVKSSAEMQIEENKRAEESTNAVKNVIKIFE